MSWSSSRTNSFQFLPSSFSATLLHLRLQLAEAFQIFPFSPFAQFANGFEKLGGVEIFVVVVVGSGCGCGGRCRCFNGRVHNDRDVATTAHEQYGRPSQEETPVELVQYTYMKRPRGRVYEIGFRDHSGHHLDWSAPAGMLVALPVFETTFSRSSVR